MAEAQYAYIGGAEMYYQGYRDTETDKMLVAQPGGSYSIIPADQGPADENGNPTMLPVPPADGRWADAPPPPPPAKAPPAVQPPQPVTAQPAPAPEGGVS